VTELGIHGFGERPDGVDWFSNVRWALDQSPAFSSVWISDHLQYQGTPEPEAWTRLTWLAASFPDLRVGTMVLSQSYRNPGLLGTMARTLQDLTHGRLVLGLGAGWLEEEYRAFNYKYPSPGVRVAQLAETIELLKTLWSESSATYRGEHFRIEDVRGGQPQRPIPIMVGTNGPRALSVVARLADWWVWDGPWEPSYRNPYERLKTECEVIGRSFEEITLVAELTVSMPNDPSSFEARYEHEFYPGQVFGIAGPTPAAVAREIETLVDAGVSHIAVNFDDRDGIGRFVDEVLPSVRLETPIHGLRQARG
jgi:alkanesulfonate monooxygenase SsuD/methylene tetrahydromethanopterin reductase-like flavin-dependent oxidoreductase (luciferase family)